MDAVRNREAGRPGRGKEMHVDECWYCRIVVGRVLKVIKPWRTALAALQMV